MKILILNHNEVKTLLPMADCIGTIEEMFRTLATDGAQFPMRTFFSLPNGRGAIGVMPAIIGAAAGAKVMTLLPENAKTHYETHQGAILLFEIENGRLLGIMDATSITRMRTAAASAVATRILSRRDSSRLAILGSGTQAASHLESMRLVREISSVRVWSRSYDHAKKFALRYHTLGVEPVVTAKEAVESADIICTTDELFTASLGRQMDRRRTHINAVGAYTSSSRETDSDAVKRSLLFVDSRKSAMQEAGDFLIPRGEGIITDSHIRGELGDLIIGKVIGRTESKQITLFKSLGLATEDVASAWRLYQNAVSKSLGTWVEFNGERDLQL